MNDNHIEDFVDQSWMRLNAYYLEELNIPIYHILNNTSCQRKCYLIVDADQFQLQMFGET